LKKITVHSYKGGQGKTTVAINLAISLHEKGFRILVVETDFTMPSFFDIFPESSPQYYLNDYFKDDSKLKFEEIIIKHQEKKNFGIVFTNPDFSSDDPVFSIDRKWHQEKLKIFIRGLSQVEKDYDHVIFDTPSGSSYNVINNLIMSDVALIILRPNRYAISGTFKLINRVYKKTKSDESLSKFLVWNQVPLVPFKDVLIEWEKQFRERYGLETLAQIPCSCNIAYEMAMGSIDFSKDPVFSEQIERIINEITNS